jgi:tRNA uridine 5-carboxymethylaminomethyl modification enzyme
MFTSRAEYRLLLREDNADARLTEKGREIGLVDDERWEAFSEKQEAIEVECQRLKAQWVNPNSANAAQINELLKQPMQRESTLEAMIRRPEVNYSDLMEVEGLGPAIENKQAAEQVEIKIKYQGYIDRQLDEIAKLKRYEDTVLPVELDYSDIKGLSNEVVVKLNEIKPVSIGQASRISGITPAAISILLIYLKKNGLKRKAI